MKKDEPINDKIKDDELDGLLEHFGDASGNLAAIMDKSYRELMFIGSAANRTDEYFKDAVQLNLRLCIRYYQNVENYLRLKDLFELVTRLGNPSKIEINDTLLKGISINVN